MTVVATMRPEAKTVVTTPPPALPCDKQRR